MTRIHATAIVDPSAELADGVEVGPHVVVEADVRIGQNCRLMTGAVVRRYTTLGVGNIVHPCAVLGGEPQDLKFDSNSQTYLRIGDNNVFREYVTLNRATQPEGATVIGSGCYFMTQSHVGHECVIGDRVVLTNNAAVGGHCEIGPRAFLSANVAIHQFCWVGEMVMMRGQMASVSQHVPPYCMVTGLNFITGLNTVGLRRAADISDQDRRQVKEAYRLLYRSSLTPREALVEMDKCADWGAPAGRFRDFVRRVLSAEKPFNRGLVTANADRRGGESEE